jgi:DNA polymerase-3 subunit delta'
MAVSLSAPWLQAQLQTLRAQRGHAFLLSGPSGLGQYELALALASAWLCERPTQQGACGECASCHAIAVRTHPDLCVLLPETLSLELGWPLDEKVQDELDNKKRKPSKEIRVDAAREAVAFTQFTRSGGDTKVVLVYPAERMNGITANTLLKTLEEPPGEVRFVLATEAAQQLLPTIRSRCQSHTMVWPGFEQALDWLQTVCARSGLGGKSPLMEDLRVLLSAAGGRPADVLRLLQQQDAKEAAARWRALPKAVAAGQVNVLSDFSLAQAVDALQKLCHDVWAQKVGALPRFFSAESLPSFSAQGKGAARGPSLYALSLWSRELATSARTAEHPYNAGLMLEALVSRAQLALRGKH